MPSVTIPNRPVFRAQEVCELVEVQPYVLRSWEAEFPDLGVTKGSQPRVYRRADVQRVIRLKHLLFVDGLTLAGARKQMAEEGLVKTVKEDDSVSDSDLAELVDEDLQDGLREVRRGLQWILGVLNGHGVTPEDRVLRASRAPVKHAAKRAAPKAARKTAKKKKR